MGLYFVGVFSHVETSVFTFRTKLTLISHLEYVWSLS